MYLQKRIKMKFKAIIALVLVGSTIFTACKDEVDIQEQSFTVTFNHHVDGQSLSNDSMMYLNDAGNLYSVIRLMYFVSDFRLHKSDGTSVLIDEEHYVDAFNANTFSFTASSKVVGSFTGVSFVFGLDTNKNVDGRYPNAPENNMEWPAAMGEGYHYMKLEGKFLDTAGMVMNYNTHTGATMGVAHHVNVVLPDTDFSVGDNAVTLDLNMNINNWYVNPNLYDFNDYGMMIMGNQDAQYAIEGNGHNVFTATVSQ